MPILTAEERVGTTIGGKYRLDRIIGKGGMATVFAATDLRMQREVAVKILHPEFAVDADVVRRFVTEARAAGSLDHPNAVRVFETGQDADATPFMVLEMLHGETLAQFLAHRQRLTYDELLAIVGPVLDALAAAHGRGIIHRDIKPDNVFLSRDSSGRTTPKLLDFGIAKVMDNARTQTATGQALGTPYYMSPEQIEGRGAIGPQSDVWSMGVVLYQCVTGTLPFFAPTLPAIFVAILTTPAAPIASLSGDIAPEAAAVIEKALARDPTQRFATARELAAALTAAAHARPGPRPRARVNAKGGGGWLGLFVAALVVVLLAGGSAAAFVYRDELMPLVAGYTGGTPAIDAPPPVVPVPVPAVTPVVVTADVDAGAAPPDLGEADAGTTASAMGNVPDLEHMPLPFGPSGMAGMPQVTMGDVQRISDECHGDDDCVQEHMVGQMMGTNEGIAAIMAQSALEQTGPRAAPMLRAYVRRFPNTPRAAAYREMLAHGLPPATHPRRHGPNGVH